MLVDSVSMGGHNAPSLNVQKKGIGVSHGSSIHAACLFVSSPERTALWLAALQAKMLP